MVVRRMVVQTGTVEAALGIPPTETRRVASAANRAAAAANQPAVVAIEEAVVECRPTQIVDHQGAAAAEDTELQARRGGTRLTVEAAAVMLELSAADAVITSNLVLLRPTVARRLIIICRLLSQRRMIPTVNHRSITCPTTVHRAVAVTLDIVALAIRQAVFTNLLTVTINRRLL